VTEDGGGHRRAPASRPPRATPVIDWGDDETWAENASSMPTVRPSLSVRELVDDEGIRVRLAVVAGRRGLERRVEHTRIQKSGLALAGHFHGIVRSRIQILGQTEQSYLESLSPEGRDRALAGFFAMQLSCVVLTGGDPLEPAREIAEHAEATGTPLLSSPVRSSATITALHSLLDDRLAPRRRLHGVLIDVFGVGLLLMGPSGVGKSEAALDLVLRGHRLVADDAVECDYRPPGMVFGQPADLLRHHLEVRGLGILNVKDLFGVTSVRERKRIDVVAKLELWTEGREYDRLGIEDRFHNVLGVQIPELAIPVRPGRDMASILEVAARNELLKNAGHDAAKEFFTKLEGSLGVSGEQESAVPPPLDADRASSPTLRRVGVPGRRAPWLRSPESSVSTPIPNYPGRGAGKKEGDP
jgi:HPr kinase/phosphorylase